jgi:predicted AAA+ superfamily ATPase
MRLERRLRHDIVKDLERMPAVALLGPRQAGKTTLAREVGRERPSIYLDLESSSDRELLADPADYLYRHADELVIIDEVQQLPDLFAELRGVIDRGRWEERGNGRFLLLGSASIHLLRQSESLAGRIAYVDLTPFDALEARAGGIALDRLWVRGGFPNSVLAADDEASVRWRRSFIRTYLERDVPELGPRIPATTLERLWTMLAHHQGSVLNLASLARSLEVSGRTVAGYVDLLVDLLLVRRLPPWISNTGKRLVRSPKVYVRDSGIVHALLRVSTYDEVLSHPVLGGSWEGFVIENLLNVAGYWIDATFYRSRGGAEADLVLSWRDGRRWLIEVRRTLVPKLRRGFTAAWDDVKPERGFVVYAGERRYGIRRDVEAIGLVELCRELEALAG